MYFVYMDTHALAKGLCTVTTTPVYFFQVVKAFITLSDSYKDAHKGELIAELQSHTKEITAPYKYPRKVKCCLSFTGV